jgi:hypothetical protein
MLGPFKSFPVKSGHLFEFIYFLSFMVDKHLEEQSFSFFADKVMHWLIDFDSVFDGSFCGFDETDLGCVLLFFLGGFL